MNDDLGKELAALARLGATDLRHRYAEVFGEPTRTGNKAWLVKRIAWRLQMLAQGRLSRPPPPAPPRTGQRCRPPAVPPSAPAAGGAPDTPEPDQPAPLPTQRPPAPSRYHAAPPLQGADRAGPD